MVQTFIITRLFGKSKQKQNTMSNLFGESYSLRKNLPYK